MALNLRSIVLVLPVVLAAPAAADEDCYCTGYDGEKIQLGETYCLRVNGRDVMAQCVMSLNNTNWRHLHQGCDAGLMSKGPQDLPPSSKPG